MATTSTITQLTDMSGNLIAPFTTEAAVYDTEGKRLNVKLTELQQGHDENLGKIDKLFDSVFPINVALTISTSSNADSDTLQWNVTEKNASFTPDSITISKNNQNIYSGKEATGSVSTSIDSNVLSYNAIASKSGRTDASKSITKYIIHYGSSVTDSVSDSNAKELIDELKHIELSGIASNLTVDTSINEYIWIIVPNSLYINKVENNGFEVTLSNNVQEITYTGTNYSGKYRAYRSLNALVDNKWNLVIS
jgi:hypothetical protein